MIGWMDDGIARALLTVLVLVAELSAKLLTDGVHFV